MHFLGRRKKIISGEPGLRERKRIRQQANHGKEKKSRLQKGGESEGSKMRVVGRTKEEITRELSSGTAK